MQIKGGYLMAKAFFSIGFFGVLLAVAGIEGGGFTLAQGCAVGIAGAVCALAAMPRTGWFE
jgi:hypothetical protein